MAEPCAEEKRRSHSGTVSTRQASGSETASSHGLIRRAATEPAVSTTKEVMSWARVWAKSHSSVSMSDSTTADRSPLRRPSSLAGAMRATASNAWPRSRASTR